MRSFLIEACCFKNTQLFFFFFSRMESSFQGMNSNQGDVLLRPSHRESFRDEVRREKEEAQDRFDCCKNFAFIFVGVLTLLYTLGELGFGVYMHVLVLLSDGFHNLSDVVALGIALWASKKSRKSKTLEYSYGYARTELLGALVNGCFLLSLSLYIFLEAIPR